MDRKTYMKEVYSKYWIDARERIYGFMDYDRRLCERILSLLDGKPHPLALEVATGTGRPFAEHLSKNGVEMCGVDISETLLERARQLNPGLRLAVCDSETLCLRDGSFDCVLCFHSSWYFPDLPKALDEMLRVTAPGGHVLIDLQNAENPRIRGIFKRSRSLYGRIRRLGEALVYRDLRLLIPVDYQSPADHASLRRHIKEAHGLEVKVYGRAPDSSLKPLGPKEDSTAFERLVFEIRKI